MAKKVTYNVIKITDNSTTNYAYGGTPKPDKVTITGQFNTFYAKGGNDIIDIKKGATLTAYGEKGNDTITVAAKAKNAKIYGGAGVDVLTINGNGNSGSSAFGGAGNDKIYIKGGSFNYAYGEAGNDNIYVTGGSYQFIEGGKGNDSIYINKGSKNNIDIRGDAGADTIRINAGNKHSVDGGDGKYVDKIYINAGKEHYVHAGSGNDQIFIQEKAVSGIKVRGDSGTNTIKVTAGKTHTIYGGTGVDKITIGGTAKNVTVYGDVDKYGDIVDEGAHGNDIITVTGGTGATIDGGLGRDKVTIKGGTGHTVDAYGDDVTVTKGSCNINMYKETGSVSLTGGTSTLKLMNTQNINFTVTAANGTVAGNRLYVDENEYTFRNNKLAQVGNNLTISGYSGNTFLTVKGFFSSGAFANGIQLNGTTWDFDRVKTEANK